MYLYYPFFRGKQYELIAIRETANLLAKACFVPIIEPVREQTNGLRKALQEICDVEGRAIVIVNPQIGDYSRDGASIVELVQNEFDGRNNFIFGLLLTEDMTVADVIGLCDRFKGEELAFIHAGFSDGGALAGQAQSIDGLTTNIFLEEFCGKLYQRHFQAHENKILVRDGFQQRRNRDHPDAPEFFSDLHVTYDMERMTGFGDYLIVGNDYRESGGPAYTIAIHLTYIDGDKDEEMHIRHFKSVRQDTPTDPAGKFAEALQKLIDAINEPNSKYIETGAIVEFRDLHKRGHYPGLGYVKKLSMKHHIETLASYFGEKAAD